jgi:hypothetical protein
MKKPQFYVGKLASKKHFATICQLRRLLILALTAKNREKTKQAQKSTKTNNLRRKPSLQKAMRNKLPAYRKPLR